MFGLSSMFVWPFWPMFLGLRLGISALVLADRAHARAVEQWKAWEENRRSRKNLNSEPDSYE